MDEAIIEMLSRYIDGDLDPDEEKDLIGRLDMDPVIRSRLEGLRKVRLSLSSLAENEEVPPDLDSLIEPLRRARPDAVATRPWIRWLATAAVAVLGLSVIIEVSQRGSRLPVQQAARVKPGQSADPKERFSLAPLPTSAVPPEEQLLGVSERLLASPIPEMEVGESPALEVLGPLEVPPAPQGEGEGGSSEDLAAPATIGGVLHDTVSDTSSSDAGRAAAHREEPTADRPQITAGEASPGPAKRSRHIFPYRPLEGEVSTGKARLFVFVDGETSWRDFEPRARCSSGRYSLRIRIGSGVVREVWPVGGATSEQRTQHLCAGELVRGLPIEEVVDGEYRAEVVVEPRGVRTD